MDVRKSCQNVVSQSVHARIDHTVLEKEIQDHPELYSKTCAPSDWAPLNGCHFRDLDNPELSCQYIMVLDSLNFCFWPQDGYEYDQLAGSLKAVVTADPRAFSASSLSSITSTTLAKWLQPPPEFPLHSTLSTRTAKRAKTQETEDATHCPIPLVEERARLLREVGVVLLEHFDGLALRLVEKAGGSALKLVNLVTTYFPGFRDHSVYKGKQVFFYKRAQIFVADVHLSFGGKGPGAFRDADQLTCFADYRLPQLMHHLGIMKYSEELEAKILNKIELIPGSHEELEIRAATVEAVELMKAVINAIAKEQKGCQEGEEGIMSLQIDNILWERGESLLTKLRPHHRTLTIYY